MTLSSDGNENGEKTIGLISQNNFARAAHFFSTFLCRCFARLQREASRNFLVTRFMEEMSYVFLFTYFSTAVHFHFGGCQHFSFSHHRYKIFMLFFQQKNVSFVFNLSFQFSVGLFLVELRWPVAYFLFFSVFIFLYFQFPLSVFVFIDSLVVSALQDAGGYAISYQNNLELHLGCHTCLLIYFTLACLWSGRTDGRTYGHVITKLSRMGRLPQFLSYGATFMHGHFV